MQQNNSDQPPSLSQLLRESYLAEARAQQRHSEMSGSDASSSRLQIYTSLKGKAEDSVGQHDPQFPDLSAFLSQEELDKSVNLARQAIGHEAREERAEVKPSVALLTLSNISTSVSSSGHPTAPPSTQPAPELKELPATHTTFTADRKLHKTVVQQENMTSNTRDPSDGFNDFDRSASNNPYGPETQSKKEFLNKAADFIEELSSLFKANSSKRVRPRVCKSLRSRNQNKNQNDGTIYPLGPDNRERCILSIEVEKEGPSPAGGHKQEAQLNSGIGHVVFKDSRITEEQQHYSVSQEVKEEEEAETETPYPAEASSEPPFFIQKLKSREVPEGSKVQLECIVQGLPVPEVRWFCEGKELENSPDIQIITNGELHSLIIAEAFEEDTGRYSCFASNFCGTDSTSAEIYVEGASSTDSEGEQHFEHVAQRQRKSSPPSSSQTPSQEENSQSQPAAATKEPAEEHNSPATYKSIPDLLVSTLATTLQVQESSTTPTVDPVQEEATPLQGFHTLTPGEPELLAASLPLNSVLPLTQTNLPEFFTSQTTDYDYPPGLNSQPIMAAPVFTKGLQDLHASEGQPVVLESHVKGVPSPQVDWFREGQPIQDSPDYRILQKMGICTLVIAEVFHEDSGMFTCTASNKYGTVSSTAALRVKGNGSDSNHLRPRRIQEPPPVNPQPEAAVTNSIKPHSSTIRLDPLISSTSRLDPPSTSTLRLDPHSSSMLRPDPFHTSLPSLRPSSLSGSSSTNSGSTSFPDLEPTSLHQNPPGSDSAGPDLSHPKPFTSQSAVEASPEQEAPSDKNPKVKGTPNHQNGRIVVVPLPDPPPNSCLKTGTQTNHKDSRVGLHVHFKLPEDEEDQQSQSSQFDEDNAILANKEPPPVLAKPKLDPAQLQILHNQVLMEQQQEPEFQAQTLPQAHRQIQIEVQGSSEGPLWSPRMHRDPMTFQVSTDTMSPPQQMPSSAPPLTTAPPLSSAAALNTTFLPLLNTYPTRASSLVTSPQPVPQLKSVPPLIVAPVTQMKTIHTSHLNLSPAALAKTAPLPQYYPPPAAKLSTVLAEPTLEQITSPTALLRSTHASLMNLTATSHSFNYAWPKELIATQTFSPVRSPSPTESPVPLLQELAAELNSSAASSPTLPPFSPPATILPTRVLMSPTSPPSLMSSPTPVSTPFLNSVFALRAQSPPQAASPTSSSSTPSPIQNPVAFLSSVLPSLTPSQPTNSMGLPRGAPLGLKKTLPKVRLPTTEDLRESRETVLHDIEKKLTLKNNTPQFVHQQKLSFVGKTASRPLGPNIPATVINYDEEYKVSNFEQRLMSEIEFRLERTPVEESDDEVQHDDVPTGKCIAPLFDKKLKNFRAMEGVPVTFSCKVVGIPFPKVYWFKDGKQILRKNTHYKKIREGDGTCALYIECTNNNDDGNYTIMAANPQGRISCSGHLIVQTGPPRNRLTPIHSQRVRTRIQEVEGEQAQEHFFQPHFLQTPGDMLAHEGKLCRLDCKVSGLPNPELMWLVNGRPIYPDLYHKMIVRENGIHSLVIDPVTQNDTGTYTCIASNKAGQSSFCLELKVVEREIKYPPQFVEKLQNTGIPDGTPVRLECQVVGMPPPLIFWKKDNESILRTKERFSMTQDATGYVCLLIQPTTKDDAGWYTVSAKNEAGIVSCTCRLDIYAQWHQSVPAPMKMAPCTGSRYAALTGQGLDIKSALPTSETNPILFSSSPPEVTLESEEL